MKFEDYTIRLNLKTCCLYEQIFGKNFLKMSDAEDALELMYCCVVANNPSLLMTFNTFKTFIQDKKVAKWIEKQYTRISEYNSQIQIKGKENSTEEKDGEEVEELAMTDIASSLIVRYGIDPHYVMYEMELWEIQPYLNQADIQRKADLISQRFWTYLTIAPHIDGKKIKSPEELVPFEWEEKKANKVNQYLENNSKAAFAFLTGRKTEEKDG